MNRKRVLIVLWVLAPFAVVVGLWFTIDRAGSRPEARALRQRAQNPTADPRQYLSSELAEERALELEAQGRTGAGGGAAGVVAGEASGSVRRIRIAGAGGRPVDLRVWTPAGVDVGRSSTGDSPTDRVPVIYALTGQDLFIGDPRPADWPAPIWGVDTALGAAIASGAADGVVIVGVPTDRADRPSSEEGAWLSERVVRATEAALPGLRRDPAGRAVMAANGRLGAAMDAGSRGTFGAVVLLDGPAPGESIEALESLFTREQAGEDVNERAAAEVGARDGGDGVVESAAMGPRVAVIASDRPRSPATAAMRGWFERRGALVFVVGEPTSPTGRGAWVAELLSNPLVELFE